MIVSARAYLYKGQVGVDVLNTPILSFSISKEAKMCQLKCYEDTRCMAFSIVVRDQIKSLCNLFDYPIGTIINSPNSTLFTIAEEFLDKKNTIEL